MNASNTHVQDKINVDEEKNTLAGHLKQTRNVGAIKIETICVP